MRYFEKNGQVLPAHTEADAVNLTARGYRQKHLATRVAQQPPPTQAPSAAVTDPEPAPPTEGQPRRRSSKQDKLEE